MQEADGVRIPEVLVPFMGGITFLPFVRDSKFGDKTAGTKAGSTLTTPTAPASGAGGAAAVKVEAKPVPPAPATVAETDPLALAIAAKGDEIRVAKANKV